MNLCMGCFITVFLIFFVYYSKLNSTSEKASEIPVPHTQGKQHWTTLDAELIVIKAVGQIKLKREKMFEKYQNKTMQ